MPERSSRHTGCDAIGAGASPGAVSRLHDEAGKQRAEASAAIHRAQQAEAEALEAQRTANLLREKCSQYETDIQSLRAGLACAAKKTLALEAASRSKQLQPGTLQVTIPRLTCMRTWLRPTLSL